MKTKALIIFLIYIYSIRANDSNSNEEDLKRRKSKFTSLETQMEDTIRKSQNEQDKEDKLLGIYIYNSKFRRK